MAIARRCGFGRIEKRKQTPRSRRHRIVSRGTSWAWKWGMFHVEHSEEVGGKEDAGIEANTASRDSHPQKDHPTNPEMFHVEQLALAVDDCGPNLS
jgi:hypothetical protein